jgi:hypothetical protein
MRQDQPRSSLGPPTAGALITSYTRFGIATPTLSDRWTTGTAALDVAHPRPKWGREDDDTSHVMAAVALLPAGGAAGMLAPL